MAPKTCPVLIGNLEIEAMGELEAAFLPSDIEQYFEQGLVISAGDVIVDVDANVGAFSIAALQRAAGDLTVFAFEPIPEVHSVLTRNIACHFGARGVAVQAAVGLAAAEIELTYYPYMTLLSSALRGAAPEGPERDRLQRTLLSLIEEGRVFPLLRVLPADFLKALVEGHVAQALQRRTCSARIAPLSELLEAHKVTDIDLLKVDVEGAELDVLDGIAPTQWPRIRQVVLEVERFSMRAREAQERLKHRGMKVTGVQDDVQRAGDFGLLYAIQD